MSYCQYIYHILKSVFPIHIPEASLRPGRLPTLRMYILKPETQWSTKPAGPVGDFQTIHPAQKRPCFFAFSVTGVVCVC